MFFPLTGPICCRGQKEDRGHTDLNHGPIGLQPIALPLSYIPSAGMSRQTTEPNIVVTAGQLSDAFDQVQSVQLAGNVPVGKKCSPAVTRIRTWVTAATTQGTNHYTITASLRHTCVLCNCVWALRYDPDGRGVSHQTRALFPTGFRGVVVITSV